MSKCKQISTETIRKKVTFFLPGAEKPHVDRYESYNWNYKEVKGGLEIELEASPGFIYWLQRYVLK